MPGFDGTGPRGMGLGTGRGMGPCGGGNGYGCGRGRGFGMGPRRGYGYAMTGEERKTALENQAQYLKQELEAVEKEIKASND